MSMMKLSKQEVVRYSRHLIIPEVRMEGQLALKAAKVLVVGTGGLGSPVGLYLAAAGVGTLGLVDSDVVDLSNLQRQIVFTTNDIGRPKVEVAAERLRALNPCIEVRAHSLRLDRTNALELFKDYDLIIDATDNYPTRYLINDVCVLLNKPYIYGSIYRFMGQVSVFATPAGPCYRCLYPEPPPPELSPSCSEGGVLGVLPGIIGTMQASEALKCIIGAGRLAAGRLIVVDALTATTRELKLKRDPSCPSCGDHPTISAPVDYEQFCGIEKRDESIELDPGVLKQWLDTSTAVQVLDVREDAERRLASLGGVHIPLLELSSRAHELDSARTIVAVCTNGSRSARAVGFLRNAGFKNVFNLKGGLIEWSERIDPSFPRY